MAVIETWYKCDLLESVKAQPLCGSLFSHNGNANKICVSVTSGGAPVELSGTVSGYVVTSEGATVPCTGTRSGNVASILLPAAAYVPGNVFITIMLTSGTTITTLCAVVATVVQSRTDTQVDPGSVVTDWTNTINATLQTVENYTGNIIATPFEALTYPVPFGKYCIYNNLLYRCITPIAASENWTSSHWVRVKLADDVSNLNGALENIGQTYPVIDLDYGSGGILSNGAIQSNNSARIRSASNSSKAVQIMVGDFYYVSPEYSAVLHIYSSKVWSSTSHVATVTDGNGVILIPPEYVGKYAAVSIRKIGHESDDISGEVSTINTKVVYYRPALGNRQTDKTLLLADYPADAQKTGEEFALLDQKIDNVEDYFLALKNEYVTSIPDNTDFDTLTTPGNYKVTSTASAATMTNIPYTAAGGKLVVSHVLNGERYMQIYFTSQAAIKVFIRFKGASTWSEWKQIAYKGDVDSVDNYIKEIVAKGSNQINLQYGSGNINDGGGTSADNYTRIRTASNNKLTPTVLPGDFVWVDSAYKAKVALYRSRMYLPGNFEGFVSTSYQNGWIAIPDTYAGLYVGIVIQKVGHETDDISADIPNIQQYVRYIRPQNSRGYTDGERPVYVAFGASTTEGAVWDGGTQTRTKNNFPDYISSVLGLETHNLAVGNTGFLSRYNGDNNIMDLIYNNGDLLSRAKLVTIMFGYGNDRIPGAQDEDVFRIGNYDDYYPYDEAGYHPSGDSDGILTMINKGATLMGCLNWCIKWINEHYPLAQLIIIFGSPSACDERAVTMTAQTEGVGVAPYKLTFNKPFAQPSDRGTVMVGNDGNTYLVTVDIVEGQPKVVATLIDETVEPSGTPIGRYYTANYGIWRINRELKKLQQVIDIPIVNLFFDGNAFDWYSTYAKDPADNTKYALFSTVPVSEKYPIGWNPHPNEAGYIYYARLVAGKVISLFKH